MHGLAAANSAKMAAPRCRNAEQRERALARNQRSEPTLDQSEGVGSHEQTVHATPLLFDCSRQPNGLQGPPFGGQNSHRFLYTAGACAGSSEASPLPRKFRPYKKKYS
ncbi:unnamed protein product [Ectocarpus sp. 8 AP-2014]